MKIIFIPLSALILIIASCSRKTVPSRVEKLKAEKQAALNNKISKSEPAKDNTNNNDSGNAIVRDSTKYVDVDYANKVYNKLAQSFADTIAMNPNFNDPSLDYTKDFVGSVNVNMRKPNYVIIHHTSQGSVDETLHTFTLERAAVSAHYVIGRDGSIHHMVNDYLRAWQAGIGKWGSVTDMNSCSVGIELDNDGYGPFTEKQINSLLKVLASLKKRFGIPQANFIGHADFAPTRKNDPNVNFPWQTLSQKGFGLWWSDTTNVQVPPDFNETQALRIIGYDIRDVGRAVIAFRRHFCAIESAQPALSPAERKVLYCLYTKYMY
ncbi:MAG: N-acetylmuramoyl-L-alanine amidase [Arachidicoccus sp.]|nr:N-acetylmuramoyl-L-alanine amidase [Arachidicoccus sp.]